MSHRLHVDNSVLLIGKLLFGISEGPAVLNKVRSSGKPLVDDWDCLKTLVILLNNLYSQSSSLHTVFFFWCSSFHAGLLIRWELLRSTVDHCLSTDWSTWGPLQTYATLGFRWNRWRRQQSRLVPLSRPVLGAPFTKDSVLDHPLPPPPKYLLLYVWC